MCTQHLDGDLVGFAYAAALEKATSQPGMQTQTTHNDYCNHIRSVHRCPARQTRQHAVRPDSLSHCQRGRGIHVGNDPARNRAQKRTAPSPVPHRPRSRPMTAIGPRPCMVVVTVRRWP